MPHSLPRPTDRQPFRPAPLWMRIPIIRHVRYYVAIYRINQHYAFYQQLGMHSGNAKYDYRIADMIWRGEL